MPFTSMTRRLAVLLLTLSSYAQWQKGIRFAPIGTSGGSAISPDAKTLAFAGLIEKWEDQFDIRAIDSIEARALPGTPSAVTPLDDKAGEFSHNYPQFLPGGKRFLFLIVNTTGADKSGNLPPRSMANRRSRS